MEMKYQYGDITKSIIGAFYDVVNNPKTKGLSIIFLKKAFVIELRKRGHKIRTDVRVTHRYDNKTLGDERIDVLADRKVALSIKKLKKIRSLDKDQLGALMESGHHAVGLVFNFNPDNPKFERVSRPQFSPKK